MPQGSGSYTVKSGDSWESIAGKTTGDQRMFAELMRANGGISMLRPGQTIQLVNRKSNPYVSQSEAAAAGMKGGTQAPNAQGQVNYGSFGDNNLDAVSAGARAGHLYYNIDNKYGFRQAAGLGGAAPYQAPAARAAASPYNPNPSMPKTPANTPPPAPQVNPTAPAPPPVTSQAAQPLQTGQSQAQTWNTQNIQQQAQQQTAQNSTNAFQAAQTAIQANGTAISPAYRQAVENSPVQTTAGIPNPLAPRTDLTASQTASQSGVNQGANIPATNPGIQNAPGMPPGTYPTIRENIVSSAQTISTIAGAMQGLTTFPPQVMGNDTSYMALAAGRPLAQVHAMLLNAGYTFNATSNTWTRPGAQAGSFGVVTPPTAGQPSSQPTTGGLQRTILPNNYTAANLRGGHRGGRSNRSAAPMAREQSGTWNPGGLA